MDAESLKKHVLNEDVASGVTSWTGDRDITKRFAGEDGVVLEVPRSQVADQTVTRPNVGNYEHEGEVLVKGEVRAKATKP